MDDVENYRALELLHLGMNLFYKTWKLWQIPVLPTADCTAETLFREIIAVRDVSRPFMTGLQANLSTLRNTQTCSSRPSMRFRLAEH
jgi:hypothetical protein